VTSFSGRLTADDGSTADVQISVELEGEPDQEQPPTTDPPVLEVPEGANAVHVQGTERYFPLDAVNPTITRNGYPGGRGTNELVLRTTSGTTSFNRYGASVQVLPSGLVPLRAADSSNLTVPVGGGVLSGHAAALPNSAADFVRSLQPGDVLEFQKLDQLPGGDIPQPDIGEGFHSWVVSGYWQQYTGPDLLTVLNQAPGYNVAWAAFALGGGGQSMTFSPRTYPTYAGTFGEDLFADHVTKWHESGRVVGISYGGGVPADRATVIQTAEHGRKVYDSLAPILDKYNFMAVDCDMENGPEGFTYEGLKALNTRLRNQYGPNFGLSSRPYEDFYYDMIGKLVQDGLCDLAQHQFYDAKETRDSKFLAGWIPERVENARRRGVPVEIQVPGAITWPGYPAGWNTADNYVAAISKIVGIRGGMEWEFSLAQRTGWELPSKLAALRS